MVDLTAVIEGDGGNNVLDGGGGINTVSYAHAASAVTVSLALQGQAQNTVGAGTDTLSNFQNLTGSAFNDTLEGNAGDNVLDGGGGINTVSYARATTGVTVSLALQGQAQNTSGAGTDTLSNFRNLTGSAGNDTLEGDGNNNVLDGVSGVDTVSYAHASAGVTVSLGLSGPQNTIGAGTDTLIGFQAVIGSAYNDTLEGSGLETFTSLTGGLGADTFVFKSNDGTATVTDFSAAQGDRIDLSSSTKFKSLSDLLPNIQQSGSDTLIQVQTPSLLPQYLVLKGISLASLTDSDFIFYTGQTVDPGIGGTPKTASGTLNGTAGSDWLQGGAGADTLHGGGGGDHLDGGAGVNTALYDGVLRQYTVAATSAPQTVSGGPEGGMDDLVNIQRIQFVDGYLATSPTDTAGQVYRLFEATLNRAPDQVGLANWVHSLNSGASLQTVANGFVTSQEFQSTSGGLDNTAFVTLLYHNVLHRDPDAAGLNNWVSELNTGHSRAEVVLGFSESQEDINDLAAPVQQGLWIQDAAAAEVARLYDATLGRLPDVSGLTGWTDMLETGTSLQTVANGFVGSAEFQANYGALDNTGFVTLLYNNVLHRAPDQTGLTNWLNYLGAGHSRAEVVIGFSDSTEHIQNTAAHVDYGIWVA